MNSERFDLKIVTPAGTVLEDVASEVVLPASDGEIGVLPGHCRYTGLLGSGTLRYVEAEGKQTHRVEIAGGFCTFADNVLTILADKAGRLER